MQLWGKWVKSPTWYTCTGIHGGTVSVPGSCKQVLSDGCAADIGVDSNVVDSVVVAEGELSHDIMCATEVT